MKKAFAFLVLFFSMTLLVSCGLSGITDKVTGGTESLDLSMEEVQTNMKNLASQKGYEISFKCTDDGNEENYTIGDTKNAKWVIAHDEDGYSGYGAVIEDGKVHIYDVTSDGEFEYNYTYTDGENVYLFDQFALAYNVWIYYGYAYSGALTKLGQTKVCGRNATEYEFNLGAAIGAIGALAGLQGFKYKFAIDNELGITLKLEASIKADNEKETLGYEVTALNIENVTIPNFPEPNEEDQEGGEEGGESQGGDTQNRYSKELAIASENDLYCQENVKFVAKYVGSKEDLADSVFVDDYNADTIYFVIAGFTEDGSIDRIRGYACMYYFYNNVDAYLAGVNAAKGKGMRGQNDSVWYFTYYALNVDAETWDELIANFNEGNEYNYHDFQVVEE